MAIDKTLKPHEKLSRNKKPVLVCILDGWGENVAKDKYNAIHSAETPVTGEYMAPRDICIHQSPSTLSADILNLGAELSSKPGVQSSHMRSH